MKIGPKTKTKFVEALRSGRYKRCTGQIRKGDRYCLLGVLADIVEPNGWSEGYGGEYRHKGHLIDLSPETAKRCGIDGEAREKFVNLNDECRWTFKRSADWIERNL